MPTPKKDNAPQYLMGVSFNLPVPPERRITSILGYYRNWIYSAVTKISRAVANIDLKLYRRVAKKSGKSTVYEIEEVEEHEALNLIYSVNDFYTKETFLQTHQTYMDIAGESVWAIVRGSDGKPAELWPLRPDWVSVIPDKDNFIKGYIYRIGGAALSITGSAPNEVKFDAKDILFFKDPNPVNPYRGKGSVQAGELVIDIDTYGDEWNRNFFYNSALPSLFFTTQQKLNKAEIDRFMAQYRNKFEGRQNAHKVAFFGGGLEPKPVGGNVRELDFLEGKKYIRDEILSLYHMSKADIGIYEDVNRASAQAAEVRFSSEVVKPRMITLVSYLNEFYLRNWPDEDLFFDYDDPTPEDVELKLKIYENGINNGWLTPNEVRKKENLAPVEGGDAVYIPFSLQPVGTVSDQQKSITRLALKVKKSLEKETRKFNIKVPPVKLAKLKKKKLEETIKSDLYKIVYQLVKMKDQQNKEENKKDFRETFWKNMVAKTDVEEKVMKENLEKLWADQAKLIKNNISNNLPKLATNIQTKALADMIFNKKEQVKIWLASLSPFVRRMVLDKAREVFDFLGIARELDVSSSNVRTYFETTGVKFISEITDTTFEDVKASLADGIDKGESVTELQQRVTDMFNEFTKDRASLIVRSEVIRSTNFATNEAYKQSKIVKKKEWLTAVDERTCPFCAKLDGKVVSVEETYIENGESVDAKDDEGNDVSYTNDYSSVKYPPLHPRCRCTIIPVIE